MPCTAPPVTVVMPVYNALPWLDAAIDSIARQTFTRFRLAIFDDHSTDGSWERAREWAARDPRIDVTRGDRRLGPAASSAAASALATSAFVARMDADDVAHPDRLTLQLAALRNDPGAVLVGSTHEMIDAAGRVIRRAAPARIAGSSPPFAHPAIMYRNAAFLAAGGYREGTDYFEDLDLYRRLAGHGRMLVINRPLLQLRFAGQHARLRDEPLAVLARIDRQYPGFAERQQERRPISPMAFYSVAVLAILTLRRPGLLPVFMRHARLSPTRTWLAVMAMIAVAETSPRLARRIGFVRSWLHERRGRARFRDGAVYRWDFGETAGAP